jgi:NADPH2:quinone reductase
MRAVLCREYGPPEVLAVEDVPVPEPGAGEVRVRVGAAALNFPDVLLVANAYQVPVPLPFTPGSEFAGVVDAVGEGVLGVHVDDPVLGTAMTGALAEFIVVAADVLQHRPSTLEVRDAAGFPVVYTTAYHALRSVAEVEAGQTVLVLGAAGGVGLAAVDLAKLFGCRVIAAASTEEKLAVCLQRGADAVVNYGEQDLRQRLRELAPAGVDVIVDPVGGPLAEAALRSGAWGARFVTVGYASGEIPSIPLNLVLLKGVTIRGFEMRTFMLHAPELAARGKAELGELLRSGRLTPYVTDVFPLEKAVDALRHLADRGAVGKVVIEMGSG